MDEPEQNDDVFCPILWQANGGKFKSNGAPLFEGDIIRGRCRDPGDCDRCHYMQGVLTFLTSQGITSLWICPECVSQIRESARELGVAYRFPGFYTEGFCQRPSCNREGDAKYSSVLQLLTMKMQEASVIP